MSSFYNPVAVFIGESAANTFEQAVNSRFNQVQRVLLLTRGGEVEQHPSLQPLMKFLSAKEVQMRAVTFSNPDVLDILELKKDIGAFDYELIVAIGGGSVMDVAKVLSALKHISLESVSDIREAITEECYVDEQAFTPWIGIPTTSGTGSEVTCWATVWDEERGKKYSVTDIRLYAACSWMLPELTLTMPMRLSVSTALDALCHAVEAYWSVHTNDITRVYALQAIELISKCLPQLVEQPDSLVLRKRLSVASLYAGLAFSNTRTTACHSISYPLTMHFGIDHGIAVSITLTTVMRHNLSAIIEPMKFFQAFGANNVDEVEQRIRQIYEMYDLSPQLGAYGVSVEDLPAILALAYTKGRMDNNPVAITEQQLHDMLVSLL